MAPKYQSSVLGSAFAPLANLLYWLMFVNFNVGIFNALPIGPFDGGQLYNSLIEKRLGSKSNKFKNVSQLVSLIMIAIGSNDGLISIPHSVGMSKGGPHYKVG